MSNNETINIRPEVSILAVLAHVDYKAWFALAEFVDNAVQSFLDNQEILKQVDGTEVLKITIELSPDGKQLTIRDNAAGISQNNYKHAFRPAAMPSDRNGLSEFGMGMKSAACWFAPNWLVRSSALGESVEKTVIFDIEKITRNNIEELEVQAKPKQQNEHFTEIILSNLRRPLQTTTVSKIKTHLASIYRVYIRQGILDLRFNREVLTYNIPDILHAPIYSNLNQPLSEWKVWRKDIEFDFGQGLKVKGFAALRAKGSTSEGGFALFRRNRLIVGSGDETYRPEFVFGKPNDYPAQRLFGELHLEGFEVSHTKDGFKWDENEETFLWFLKKHINSDDLPLLKQASISFRDLEDIRKKLKSGQKTSTITQTTQVSNPTTQDSKPVTSQTTQTNTSTSTQSNQPITTQTTQTNNITSTQQNQVVTTQTNNSPIQPKETGSQSSNSATTNQQPQTNVTQNQQPTADSKKPLLKPKPVIRKFEALDDVWEIEIELLDNPAISEWLFFQEHDKEGNIRKITIRLALAHPFMIKFDLKELHKIEPVLQLAMAMVISQIKARNAGVRLSDSFRVGINTVLNENSVKL